MASDQVSISPEEVRTVATHFGNAGTTCTDLATQLANVWEDLSTRWLGVTARQVDEKMAEWKAQMSAHAEMLSHIRDVLNTCAQEFQDVDQKSRSL